MALGECREQEHALTVFRIRQKRDDRVRMRLYTAVALSVYRAMDSRYVTIRLDEAALTAQTLDDAEYQLQAFFGICRALIKPPRRSAKAKITWFSGLQDEVRWRRSTRRRSVDRGRAALPGDQDGQGNTSKRMLLAMYTETPVARCAFSPIGAAVTQMYLARTFSRNRGCRSWKAARVARPGVEDARATNHVFPACNALAGNACPVTSDSLQPIRADCQRSCSSDSGDALDQRAMLA